MMSLAFIFFVQACFFYIHIATTELCSSGQLYPGRILILYTVCCFAFGTGDGDISQEYHLS